MAERTIGYKIDRYLRREDTLIARGLARLSDKTGNEYKQSAAKRALELSVAIPGVILASPVVGTMTTAVRLEDGGPAFFRQERIGKDGKPITITKIRSMRADADARPWSETNEINQTNKRGEDPRSTRIGRKMRQYEIEELPQLAAVAAGRLSLVGIRAMPQGAIDFMDTELPHEVMNKWKENYRGMSSLMSLNSARNPYPKDDLKRHHYDNFYARKQSLGFDLYIIYRTAATLAQRFRNNHAFKQKHQM